LTETDEKLIKKLCKTSTAVETYRFKTAYTYAKLHRKNFQNAEQLLTFVDILSKLADKRNTDGYRKGSVRLANGDFATKPAHITTEMKDWAAETMKDVYYISFSTNKERLNTIHCEFRKIHPLVAGNEKIGHLVWAALHTACGEDWPTSLPPDPFKG